MNATLVVLRIDGHGTEHLSLHTKREQALRRLVEVGGQAWHDRFGYRLTMTPRPSEDAATVSDRLVAEGWRVRLQEQEVEL